MDGLRGMGRVWQAAATVESVLRPGLVEKAAAAGLRSLFIGFETLNDESLRAHGKPHNRTQEYEAAIRRLHDLGVMVNASFVFGMDGDDASVFDRTVGWAVERGIETATFHVPHAYRGTEAFRRFEAEGRILHRDWDLYDTRHAVFRPLRMTAKELSAATGGPTRSSTAGARSWPPRCRRSRGSRGCGTWPMPAAGRSQLLWSGVIRLGQVARALPLLGGVAGR